MLVGHSMGGMTHHRAGRAAPRAVRRPGRRRRPDLDHRRRARRAPDPAAAPAVRARRRSSRTRLVATLARGHRTVDGLRRVGRSVATVATDTLRVRRRRAGELRRLRRRDALRDAVRGGGGVLPELRRAGQVRDRRTRCREVPTTIICGTEDKLTSIGHSRKLHARIDGSTLLECEGAGHMVIIERHDQVNAALDQLLAAAGGAGRQPVSVDVRRGRAGGRRDRARGGPPRPSRSARRSTRRPTRWPRPRSRWPTGSASTAGCWPASTASRSGRWCSTPSATTMYLRRFGVVPEARGHGVAGALIEPAVEAPHGLDDLDRGGPRGAARDAAVLGAAGLPRDPAATRRTSSCGGRCARSCSTCPTPTRCASSGARSPASCGPATWWCSAASSVPARPRSPRASVPGSACAATSRRRRS